MGIWPNAACSRRLRLSRRLRRRDAGRRRKQTQRQAPRQRVTLVATVPNRSFSPFSLAQPTSEAPHVPTGEPLGREEHRQMGAYPESRDEAVHLAERDPGVGRLHVLDHDTLQPLPEVWDPLAFPCRFPDSLSAVQWNPLDGRRLLVRVHDVGADRAGVPEASLGSGRESCRVLSLEPPGRSQAPEKASTASADQTVIQHDVNAD